MDGVSVRFVIETWFVFISRRDSSCSPTRRSKLLSDLGRTATRCSKNTSPISTAYSYGQGHIITVVETREDSNEPQIELYFNI